ncbi:polysialyltransferase family glycosyltransferase [Thioalkalivibrio sp. XN279]|uniref:polysialyltransferase family glycosyltransferase n=1 Tax=Thioalkalivibrio sp. XN279 TaxID=2714953 RepID=UPI00140BD85C|nr:hypothetical protein [Thioalkalivibrio sp. XN279]
MAGYNYYFISSPLHFLLSVNMAIRCGETRSVAVISSRIESNARLLREVIERDGRVFCDVITLESGPGKGHGSKARQRKQRMQVLREYLAERPAARIFTGTDRHVEFQYAMHIARQHDPAVEGIYLDDGLHTYLGSRRMHSFQHKYGDALLKKLYYGWWWKNPVILGTSGWISKVYAVFPELVHPVYREMGKTVLPFDAHYFADPAFAGISRALAEVAELDRDTLGRLDFVLLLTHEQHYADPWAHMDKMMQLLGAHAPPERIAIKAHPRSRLLDELRARYPRLVHLDNRVGFELLLPFLRADCVFLADISSSLFTVKWLQPKQRAFAIEVPHPTIEHYRGELQALFTRMGIQQVSYAQLETELEKIAADA